MYNHGGNDNYMVKAQLDEKGRYVRNEKGEIQILRDAKGKPIPATVEDMNSGRAVMGRAPGKDEQFLVVNEEGDLLIMDSPEQLEEFHRSSGMIWEYDATPAIAPAANAQIILGAERTTRESETAKAQ
jgi:hypothetical protein